MSEIGDWGMVMPHRKVGGFRIVPRGKNGEPTERHVMHAPYGLEIIESCLRCPHRQERLFCNLSPAAVQRLSSITSPSTHPKGATLFVEGQSPRGVYILCSGRIKLSTTSADGKTLIVRMSEPGEVLGLPATVTGSEYELTADVVEPSQVNFIPRQEFLNFLRDHGEAALRVAQQLGETYHSAVSEMRTIGLSHSASEKLARFLLDWCSSNAADKTQDGVRAHMTLTHEEIAQVIGSSRETVTRLFSEFKRKQLLEVKGSTLVIPSKAALEVLLNTPH